MCSVILNKKIYREGRTIYNNILSTERLLDLHFDTIQYEIENGLQKIFSTNRFLPYLLFYFMSRYLKYDIREYSKEESSYFKEFDNINPNTYLTLRYKLFILLNKYRQDADKHEDVINSIHLLSKLRSRDSLYNLIEDKNLHYYGLKSLQKEKSILDLKHVSTGNEDISLGVLYVLSVKYMSFGMNHFQYMNETILGFSHIIENLLTENIERDYYVKGVAI